MKNGKDTKINISNKKMILINARHWVMLPASILEMTEISSAAKLVWAALCNYGQNGGGGRICPSIGRVARDVGLGWNTVQRAIQELKAVRPGKRLTRKEYAKECKEAKEKKAENPDAMLEVVYNTNHPNDYFILAPDWIFNRYPTEAKEEVHPKLGPTRPQVGTEVDTKLGYEEEQGEEEQGKNTGAGAPELAEGQISGPEEAPEEEAEEAPEEAPEEALEEEAKKFLDPNITRPWEEAPEEEQLRPAKAPPKRATFAEVEAGLKYTMPKKPLKKDLGRGPSAGAVAPAAADPSGPDHSETTLAGWGQRKWAKAFLAAYQTTNRRVQGEERLSVLDKTVQELRNLLGSEGLTHQQQYHLMCEWLPKNLAAYKFKGIVAPAYLANKLHEYLPAWKQATRPRKPLDLKTINFRQV